MGDPLGGGSLPPLNTVGSNSTSSNTGKTGASPLGSSAAPLNTYKGESAAAAPSYYDKMRAKILAKRAASSSMKSTQKSSSGLSTGGTGSAFSKKKFRKQLKKVLRKGSSSYGSSKKDEAKVLEDIIVKKMKGKSAGGSISGVDKMKMRGDLSKAQKSGDISKMDLNRFKNIVNKLKE